MAERKQTEPQQEQTAPQPVDRQLDRQQRASSELELGQRAFEAGEYRRSVQALERSLTWAPAATALHGEIQIWLVMAYDAAGDRELALALCKKTTHHPQWAIRQEAKRLLYILEAPALARRDNWTAKIPDLTDIPSHDEKSWARSPSPTTAPRRSIAPPQGYVIPAPTDPTQVEVEDQGLIWLMLIVSTIVVGGLIWLA